MPTVFAMRLLMPQLRLVPTDCPSCQANALMLTVSAMTAFGTHWLSKFAALLSYKLCQQLQVMPTIFHETTIATTMFDIHWLSKLLFFAELMLLSWHQIFGRSDCLFVFPVRHWSFQLYCCLQRLCLVPTDHPTIFDSLTFTLASFQLPCHQTPMPMLPRLLLVSMAVQALLRCQANAQWCYHDYTCYLDPVTAQLSCQANA